MCDPKLSRQTAAGDQLRVIYDNLSKDPNSLANLDQDLPNYAQHQVTQRPWHPDRKLRHSNMSDSLWRSRK